MTDTLPPDLAAVAELLRRSAQDEAPPPHVLARALALDGRAARIVRSGSAVLRRLVAVAVPDSGTTGFAPAFGVRGAAPAGHQWLFRAEECEIDLRVSGSDEAWVVSGQLFGAADANRVVLSHAGRPDAVFALGPTSEFAFTGLRAGRYALKVKLAELDIEVPELVVGPVGDG